MENHKHQVAGNSGRTCRVRCTRSWMRWIQHPQMMQMINVPKAVNLWQLWWWVCILCSCPKGGGDGGVAYVVFDGAVCVFFFFEFFGIFQDLKMFFGLCNSEKWCNLKNKTSPKNQQKALLANSQAMWLVKWFDSSFQFFKPTFIRDKHTRKSIKGLILSKLLTIHRFDL